jgi:hypothetical protein
MGNDKKDEKPKKGFLDKLKEMAFETVEESSTEASSTEGIITPPSPFNYNYNAGATPVVGQTAGVFDQSFYNNFQRIIEENNIEGVDYLEFYKAKKSFDSMIGMADPAKFQTAFLSLKAISPTLSKLHLTTTADVYLEKLAKEDSEFKAEMVNEVETKVNSKLKAAKEKEESIKSKQEQIAKLTAEISELGIGISQDNTEAQQAQMQIDTTAKNFQVTLDIVRNEINSNKEGIKNYIQE